MNAISILPSTIGSQEGLANLEYMDNLGVLIADVKTIICTYFDNPLLIAQLNKRWRWFTRWHLYETELRQITDLLKEKLFHNLYNGDLPTCAPNYFEQLVYLFDKQHEQLKKLLGEEKAKEFQKQENSNLFTATRYQNIQQWISDYNFLILCSRMADQNIADPAIEKLKQCTNGELKESAKLDVLNIAKELRESLQTSTLDQTTLDLSGAHLTELPPEICLLTGLTELKLTNNFLVKLPSGIGQLSKLKVFEAAHNQLTAIPSEIGQFKELNTLNLGHNQLTALPSEIGKLGRLAILDASHNQLTAIPLEIRQLIELTSLHLSHNQLTRLPSQISQLGRLAILDASHNQLTEIPSEISQLDCLYALHLNDNKLAALPFEPKQFKSLMFFFEINNPYSMV